MSDKNDTTRTGKLTRLLRLAAAGLMLHTAYLANVKARHERDQLGAHDPLADGLANVRDTMAPAMDSLRRTFEDLGAQMSDAWQAAQEQAAKAERKREG